MGIKLFRKLFCWSYDHDDTKPVTRSEAFPAIKGTQPRHWSFVCLFVLRLNVPVNNFLVMSGRSHRFLVINQYFRGVKCLAQGHNTAAIGIEPPTSRSRVRHSTTEPPRSPDWSFGTAVTYYPCYPLSHRTSVWVRGQWLKRLEGKFSVSRAKQIRFSMSQSMTKSQKHPAKTQISLSIWAVFAVCMKKLWILG